MRARVTPRPSALLLPLALSLATPAAAQDMTAKDAWEAIIALVDGNGGQISTTGILREGDDLIAQGTILRLGAAPAALTVGLGALRISPADEGFVILPDPTITAVVLNAAPGEERHYTITHDGGFSLDLAEEVLTLGLGFDRFAVVQTAATADGRPLDEALDILLEGLDGSATLTLSEPFDLEGALGADLLRYSFRTAESDGFALRQSGNSETERVTVSIAASALAFLDSDAPGSLRRAFDGGFRVVLTIDTGPTTGQVDQEIGGMPLSMALSGGDSTLELAAEDGAFRFSTTVDGYSARITSPMASGEAGFAQFDLSLGFPIIATEADQPFHFRLNLADLTLDDGLLAPLGGSSFAGEPATLALDLSATGRWLAEITDLTRAAQQPIDIRTINLASLVTRIGVSALTGSGAFSLTPGAPLQSDAPDGTGDFVFDLVGGEVLLNRLGAAGLLPPDQQFLARMMMNGLGRPVGADHLRSEVTIRPGGQITVNGAPLPF